MDFDLYKKDKEKSFFSENKVKIKLKYF